MAAYVELHGAFLEQDEHGPERVVYLKDGKTYLLSTVHNVASEVDIHVTSRKSGFQWGETTARCRVFFKGEGTFDFGTLIWSEDGNENRLKWVKQNLSVLKYL